MKLTIITLLCLISCDPLPAQAQQIPLDPLLRWMNGIAQQQLQRRESAIGEIRTVADAERRKQWAHTRLLDLLGGLPDYNGPLNPRVTGSIKNDSYIIEKVIFESLPDYYVTANLYRPNGSGRHPAVLLSSGHMQPGKTEPQRIAANLALKGFVALTYDPVGQGERVQTFDRRLGGALAGWGTNEHIQAGAQSLLIGQSVARYFIWDAKRALDYLLSRPEVDAARVGCAGCSGGGTLTTYIAALDSRIKAAAPACYLNSFQLLFSGQTPDNEMSLPNFLHSGLDMADWVELSAPTPWLILSTEQDYFTPEGARLVYEEARRWYRLYDAENRVRFFVGPGPHGTPIETREAIYEWMIRWLKNGQGDFHEQPVKLYPDHELRVTTTGQVENEPHSRKLYELILEEFHAKKAQGTTSELLAEVRRLASPSERKPPPSKILKKLDGQQWHTEQITLETEPGLEIEGKLYVPHSPGRKPSILLVADKSTASLAEAIVKRDYTVLDLEVRYSPAGYNDNRPYLGEWLSNTRAGMIGRNLPSMRVHDILQGVDFLAARNDVDPTSIRAAARELKGIWLLLAAAIDNRIAKVWLDRTPYSLRAALETPLCTNLHDVVIPGFILHWDLLDLVEAMGNRPVLWTDPTSWMGRTVPRGDDRYRYRYLGEPDDAYIEEFLR
jgi:cephalosporin-C deacetylase-like acetyl esterase